MAIYGGSGSRQSRLPNGAVESKQIECACLALSLINKRMGRHHALVCPGAPVPRWFLSLTDRKTKVPWSRLMAAKHHLGVG